MPQPSTASAATTAAHHTKANSRRRAAGGPSSERSDPAIAIDQPLQTVRPALDVALALLRREEAAVPHRDAGRGIRRLFERQLGVGGVLFTLPPPLQPQPR